MFETVACVDTSYITYHILFSAVKKWKSESPNSDILDADMTEEGFEQADITIYPDFVDTLKSKIYDTMLNIKTMINDFNGTFGNKLKGPVLFVMDPPEESKLKSWRYLIYKDYKGKRAAARNTHPFHVRKAFNKIIELMIENDKLKKEFNAEFIFADGCEADDIIATYFSDESLNGIKKFLIASDKDYLQLKNVTQMTLEGKEVTIEQPYPDLITITPETYLLAKIITGDVSDNIPQVFNRVGYKTAVKKYVANLQYLTESLENDVVAKNRFKKNTELIDFKKIPKTIRSIAKGVLGLTS